MFDSRSIIVFAHTISNQPLGLVYHHPENWAKALHCFANAMKKVQQEGGRVRFGWTFSCRAIPNAPELGYLMATHHAVWQAPDRKLVDITPFHADEKHRPYAQDGSILFLIDDKAEPIAISNNVLAPLPLKFFPLSNDEHLLAHVEQIRNEEDQQCKEMYQGKWESMEGTFIRYREQ